MNHLSIIVAVAENGVIGRAGRLPWRLSADLQRFKRLTMGRAIVMGRKTWESLGRQLPGRRMIVVSRQTNYQTGIAGVAVVPDLASAIQLAGTNQASGEVGEEASDETFIIGGAELYREALPLAARLYLTRVHAPVEGDTYFPEFDAAAWRLVESVRHEPDANNDHSFSFEVFHRI